DPREGTAVLQQEVRRAERAGGEDEPTREDRPPRRRNVRRHALLRVGVVDDFDEIALLYGRERLHLVAAPDDRAESLRCRQVREVERVLAPVVAAAEIALADEAAAVALRAVD